MDLRKLFFHRDCNGNFYRIISTTIKTVFILHQVFIFSCDAYYLDNNPYKHKQVLGPKASFVVEWSVNWKERSILFQVSAETKGWVGFGLSKDGRMAYSDAIVGGVDSYSGKPYFNDLHINSNRSLQIDQHQDWKLVGAWEKGKRTYLSFIRSMDTCDFQDYPITKDLVVLIWAFGDTDEIQYHQKRRGSVPVYLLDPAISEELAHSHYRQIGPHSNLYLVQRWAATNKLRLSSSPVSVWCSIEQGPRLLTRHDIVGMGAFLPTKLARQHVQQILLYKCTSPQQTEAQTFFYPYTRFKGEECFMNEKRTIPQAFCRELIYAWNRGGKPFYFPDDIGIPIGLAQSEFYLLETHFDNPKGKPDLDIEAGVEVVYSHRQKSNSASLLQIGYGPFGTFMLPPGTKMSIYGSCGPKCTTAMFPKKGVSIFAASLNSRSLGRRISIRHFRGGEQELPWILKDDNYDSEYQQMRLLNKQVTILPGDQLTTECLFDSKTRNMTSFSGFSTQDEVCAAFVYVSARLPFFRCTSELPADQILSKYGVRNFTWDLKWQDRYVTAPQNMVGTWLGDVVDDDSKRMQLNMNELQHDFKYGKHLESCPNIYDMMGHSQNQLFRTFTNDWEEGPGAPVATITPYITSTVYFPASVEEYNETSYCESSQTKLPMIDHNDACIKLLHPGSISHVRNEQPYLGSGTPPAPPPPNPPMTHQSYSFLLLNDIKTNNPSSASRSIPIPPLPVPPPANPVSEGGRNRLNPSIPPVPRSPSPPLRTSINTKRPKPSLQSMDKWIPVPRPRSPQQPPITSSEFGRNKPTPQQNTFPSNNNIAFPQLFSLNNFFPQREEVNNQNPPVPNLQIPTIQDNKRFRIPNDKTIKNFFDQIANIFASTSTPKLRSADSFSFQEHVHGMSHDFIRKRKLRRPKVGYNSRSRTNQP